MMVRGTHPTAYLCALRASAFSALLSSDVEKRLSFIVIFKPHPRGHLAQQLIADRPRRLGDLLHRQPLAPEDHLLPDGRLRALAQIQAEHVHGNPPHDRHPLAIDQYRRAAGHVARIAVAVADGHHAHRHGLGTAPRAPVADRLARLVRVNRDQLRAQGHHRAQVVLFADTVIKG